MIVEIRVLNLKPGEREKFHQLFEFESIPLQRKWGIEVTAFGPSLHDEDSFFVVRAFKDLQDRQSKEDDFYGSDDWQKGPRTAMLSLIENYADIVVSGEKINKWFSNL